MNVTCSHCRTKVTIPDHKIPKDREVLFKCPKCKRKLEVPPKTAPREPDQQSASQISSAPPVSDDGSTALICVDDPVTRRNVHATLTGMDFQVLSSNTSKMALSKMQYHIFNVLVLSDDFDGGKGRAVMIDRLNRMDMTQRRRTCLVLISRPHKTNDAMTAFRLSVNHIINQKDISDLDQVMLRAITDHQNQYAVFKDCLAGSRPG